MPTVEKQAICSSLNELSSDTMKKRNAAIADVLELHFICTRLWLCCKVGPDRGEGEVKTMAPIPAGNFVNILTSSW